MAVIEWYDPEAACVRKARFTGEQPEHVTEAIERAHRFEILRAQGFSAESATAQLDAEAEARREDAQFPVIIEQL